MIQLDQSPEFFLFLFRLKMGHSHFRWALAPQRPRVLFPGGETKPLIQVLENWVSCWEGGGVISCAAWVEWKVLSGFFLFL